jgi:hypothetical protein
LTVKSKTTESWKPFPSNYLEKRLDLVPVDLFETGQEDTEYKKERLADYPDYPDDESDDE